VAYRSAVRWKSTDISGGKIPPKHPSTSVGLHVFISKKNEFFSRRELTGSGKQQHNRAASGQNSFWVAYEHTNKRQFLLSVFPMSWQCWVRRRYNIFLLLNGQNKRKYGVHPINQTCSSYGEFYHLYFQLTKFSYRFVSILAHVKRDIWCPVNKIGRQNPKANHKLEKTS
jgi:hypothetical protein